MINKQHIEAVLAKSQSARMIFRAAAFLYAQAARNYAESRHIRARRESSVYIRTTNNAADMLHTSLALQQIGTSQHPTCEYCGCHVQRDRMLCDNCNDAFADASF